MASKQTKYTSLNKKELNFYKKNGYLVKEKLISIFKEDYGFEESLVLSVLNNEESINPYELLKKIRVIDSILANSDYKELFANAKRVSNILKKSNLNLSLNVNKKLLRESSEKILYNAINDIKDDLESSLTKNDYTEYFKKLNTLNVFIKIFFEEVMINTNDENIKLNRLSLLVLINSYYNNVANTAILSR